MRGQGVAADAESALEAWKASGRGQKQRSSLCVALLCARCLWGAAAAAVAAPGAPVAACVAVAAAAAAHAAEEAASEPGPGAVAHQSKGRALHLLCVTFPGSRTQGRHPICGAPVW
eukprot:1154880-Pelagomonas_calceolata.AAC.11